MNQENMCHNYNQAIHILQEKHNNTTEKTYLIQRNINDDESSITALPYISKGLNSKRKKRQKKRAIRRQKYQHQWADSKPIDPVSINIPKKTAEMIGTTIAVSGALTAFVAVGPIAAITIAFIGATGAAGTGVKMCYKRHKNEQRERMQFNAAIKDFITHSGKMKLTLITFLAGALTCASAFVAPIALVQNQANTVVNLAATSESSKDGRREFITATTAAVFASIVSPQVASASGGATAGKYTTIPIAKRRYYGRVQEAVHEFLLLGPDVVKGDMTATSIQDFFDVTKTVIIEAKRKDINGQCTKKDGNCKGAEVRDSRYNDMKTSMYLLGNAFRINQTKAPDNLPTVKAAKAFFKEMDAMEKAVVKKPKKNDPKAVARYANALDILDVYLDLVELPPTSSGHYDQEFSTLVGESSRLT